MQVTGKQKRPLSRFTHGIRKFFALFYLINENKTGNFCARVDLLIVRKT